MKVIDLLNKIANGEHPQKFKWLYDDNIYTWAGNGYLCYSTGYARERAFLEGVRTDMMLNTTVEIIEENNKIEKLKGEDKGLYIDYSKANIVDKINEIIDEINKLKEDK